MEAKDVYIGMEVRCVGRGFFFVTYGEKYKVRSKMHEYLGVDGLDGVHIESTYHVNNFEPVKEPTEKNCRTSLHSERTDGEYPCNSTCETDLIFNNWQPKKSEPVVHKFHVGQPVRCIESDYEMIEDGVCYTIRDINTSNELLYLEEVPGKHMGYNSSRFEPAYKLEVGCEVRVVGFDGYNKGYNGFEGTYIETAGKWIIILDENGHANHQFKPENLIVLEPAPRKVEALGMATASSEWKNYKSDPLQDILDAKESLQKHFGKEMQESIRINLPDNYGKDMVESSIKMFAHTLDLRKKLEDSNKRHFIGIDWADYGKVTINKGGNRMKTEEIKDIAKQLSDEYTGYEPDTGIITLKEMGKVTAEKTKVIIQMNDEDWVELLKKKGITKGLGTFTLAYSSPELTVEIATIEKVKKPKSRKPKNEED